MGILVTGTPGSGKTTLVKYAKHMGNEIFFDADRIAGLCEWREFGTGEVQGLVDDIGQPADDQWYAKHGWYWRVDRLQQFLAENPNAILCGSSENVTDCYQYFDHIVILQKTPEELLQNLQSPDRQNPFGKTEKQRANFLKWQTHLISGAQNFPQSIVKGNTISDTYKKIVNLIAVP
jgi:shikimate kinase